MNRIYVASSWKNNLQKYAVSDLRAQGHQVYDFRNPPYNTGFAWSQIDPAYKHWTSTQYRKILQSEPVAARGFMSDYRAMQWADTCLLLLPCGRSAHLEAGWFCGVGKRCIILLNDGDEPELMNLMATDICVSMEEVLKCLSGID